MSDMISLHKVTEIFVGDKFYSLYVKDGDGVALSISEEIASGVDSRRILREIRDLPQVKNETGKE